MWPAERRSGKADAYNTLLKRIEEGHTEEALIRCGEMYLQSLKKKGTEIQYYLLMATFFGPIKRRYEDFIDEASIDPTQEPDWWESAKKLIRNMSPSERATYGVPYPLPKRLDYRSNFGR